MKHRVAGRKLGRTSQHRTALLRNLSTALFQRERIITTLGKAKELRPFAERLVTLSKRETLHSRRQVLRHINDRDVVAKLFDTLSARYAERPGGYTRIIKLGPRRGDSAEMAIIELVGYEPDFTKKKADTKGRGKAKAAKGAEEGSEKEAAGKPEKKAKEKPAKPAKTDAKSSAKPAKAAKPEKPAKAAKKAAKAAPAKAVKKSTKNK